MNKLLHEGVDLAKSVNSKIKSLTPKCEVILGTPFIHITEIVKTVDNSVISIAAQNCADKASGAYTGEVSAAMIKSTGAKYVIIGHSERRAYYSETATTLKAKVDLALENDLSPIFCVGEVLSERESNKHFEVISQQISEVLFHLSNTDFSKIILAYEPIWAIGTGKTASSDQAQEVHAFIRKLVSEKYSTELANNISILYGGSCNPTNARELFANEDVDGGLIGGASLKADDFISIIDSF